MNLNENVCNICLESDKNLNDTNEFAEDNVKYITKLISCVPELDRNKSYFLCQGCVSNLNFVYEFQRQCLQSLKLVKRDSSIQHSTDFSDADDNKQNIICSDDDILDDDVRNKENSLCNSLLNKKFKTNHICNSNQKAASQSEKDNSDVVIKNMCGTVSELICFNCDKKFKDKNKLIEHLNTFHNDQSNKSDDIDKKESAKVKGKRKRLADNQLFQCTICTSTFSTKYLLSRHIRNVHATEKKHNCDTCGQKFASPVYLAAHKRYHSGERPHICSSCGKGFITTSDLYHHEKIHANKRSYKCDKCPKAFNTSSDLHKHNICVHMDRNQWKYVCVFCDKRFPLKTNMDTHVKIHTGEKNFPCHMCERRFINKSVLLRHIETHSNVRSFRCDMCNQEYKYRKSLDIHMRKVHGIGDAKIPERSKKYICHICPKAYYANNKLQKHIRMHTGERPFSCNECEKKFIDQPCLNQHRKSTHSILFGILNN